jgi:hypothetical protein
MERVLEEISFLAPYLARVAKDADQADAIAKAIKDETTSRLPYLERETQIGMEKVFLITPELCTPHGGIHREGSGSEPVYFITPSQDHY